MIKHIIFDIGNVLTDFRWHDFLMEKGFSEEMIQRIAKASIENPLWREFDRGVWTDEEMMAAFVKADPAIEAELELAFGDITGMVTIRDYAIDWILSLKEAGYHVWYLSNFSRKAEVQCADCLAFLPYMDGGILSYQDKLIKPDPAIYKLLLNRYQLEADECVFIDDTAVNIVAAEEQGIHGIVFTTKGQVDADLKHLGVSV